VNDLICHPELSAGEAEDSEGPAFLSITTIPNPVILSEVARAQLSATKSKDPDALNHQLLRRGTLPANPSSYEYAATNAFNPGLIVGK
jgi:hypothetical protein